MLSPKLKRNSFRILPFGILWFLAGLVYTLVEKGILGNMDYYPATENPYNFINNLWSTPLFSLLLGLLIGAFEIRFLSGLFKQGSLTLKIVAKTAIYLVIMFLFLFTISLINNAIETKSGLFSAPVMDNVMGFVNSFAFWSVQIYIGVIIVFSLFINEMSDNLGSQVVFNFLTGKYHTPKQEERIFMFLDMKSSTSIAERLGHIRYFNLLKEYYQDLSPSILQCGGEVYQYIGDEIVVTWKTAKGLQDTSCIRCFFSMKQALQLQAGKYRSKYAQVPEFKAGFHVGEVTTGELGVIKKDIVFTGDALNTTARIQSLCNHYGQDLLLSGDLLKLLDLGPEYRVRDLGSQNLRGRDQPVSLFTINEV